MNALHLKLFANGWLMDAPPLHHIHTFSTSKNLAQVNDAALQGIQFEPLDGARICHRSAHEA
eukprot:10850744-Alexandrium_andersonii.AAC.1